jgi:hypothetical protein
MKYIIFCFLFVILFSGFVVSQVEVDFVKDSYFSGETVQAEIIVSNLDDNLRSNMLELYQDGSDVPTSFNLVKLDSTNYYLYFDLGGDFSGDYDLVFEDIIFSENGSTHQSDFSFPLSVQETNNSIFSINPGFVKADDLQFNNLFYVYLFNRGDEGINIVVDPEDDFVDVSTNVVPLSPQESGYFTIYLSDLLISGESGMKYVNLLSGSFGYSLPVWLGSVEDTVDVEESGVYFVENSEFFDVTVNEGESLEGGYVRFKNGLDYAIDVRFRLTGNLDEVIDLEFESLEDVGPQEVVSLGLNVFGAEAGSYEGNVIVYYGPPYEDTFLIRVNVLDVEDEVVVSGTVNSEYIGGDDVVDPDVLDEEDDESTTKLSTLFWILLFVLIVVLLVFLRYKKKKVKKPHPFFQK